MLDKMNPKIAQGLISQLAVQVREQSECIWLVFWEPYITALCRYSIDVATRWDSLSKIICIKCNQGSKSFLKKKTKKKPTKKQKWNSEDAFLTDTQQNNIKALSQVLFF